MDHPDELFIFRGTGASEPDKGLDHPSKETLELKLARHGDQTDALLVAADEWLVIDPIVSKVEIACCEQSPFMGEVPGQNTCQFDP